MYSSLPSVLANANLSLQYVKDKNAIIKIRN